VPRNEGALRLAERLGRQSQHEALVATDSDLILAVGREDVLNRQNGFARRGRLQVEIDEAAPEVRVLLGDHAGRAPYGRVVDRELFYGLRVDCRLRAAGQYPEPRRRSPFRFEDYL
jgi:hypothetical protein